MKNEQICLNLFLYLLILCISFRDVTHTLDVPEIRFVLENVIWNAFITWVFKKAWNGFFWGKVIENRPDYKLPTIFFFLKENTKFLKIWQ